MQKRKVEEYSLIASIIFGLFLFPSINDSFAEGIKDVPNLYKKANEHFMIGEYHEAIELYDKILEIVPTNTKTADTINEYSPTFLFCIQICSIFQN